MISAIQIISVQIHNNLCFKSLIKCSTSLITYFSISNLPNNQGLWKMMGKAKVLLTSFQTLHHLPLTSSHRNVFIILYNKDSRLEWKFTFQPIGDPLGLDISIVTI